jgi:YihY family inner membrane protein
MDVQRLVARVDGFQQRHRPLAFGVAVAKKFGDDEGGNLCAMLTYYGFLSLFPLLLLFFTILGFVLDGNPSLANDLRTSALANLPVIGEQIGRNVTSVQGSGIALVVGLLGTLWGALGIANAAQSAMNRVWGVPRTKRPGFVPRIGRDLAMLATIGLAVVLATVVSSAVGYISGNVGWRLIAAALAIVVNVGVFLLAFRILTARDLAWSAHLPGAVGAAIAFEILQVVGGAYVSHTLAGMSQTYGMFAIVLGALAWIFLQARVFVYAAEVNVVKRDRLWPRSLRTSPPVGAPTGAGAGGDGGGNERGGDPDDERAAGDGEQRDRVEDERVVGDAEPVGEGRPRPPARDRAQR